MSDATLTKETSDIRNPRGERSCVNGVDHNGEPTKEQYVRAQWADSRITALERENAELHQVCKDWKQLHENNEGCIAGLRAELQRSHEPLQGRDEVAWLIEQSFNSKAHWWYGSDFTDDAAQAVRFARKQDADQVILERGMVDAVASEHMWCQFETDGVPLDKREHQSKNTNQHRE